MVVVFFFSTKEPRKKTRTIAIVFFFTNIEKKNVMTLLPSLYFATKELKRNLKRRRKEGAYLLVDISTIGLKVLLPCVSTFLSSLASCLHVPKLLLPCISTFLSSH
jgi:hypothetical protein